MRPTNLQATTLLVLVALLLAAAAFLVPTAPRGEGNFRSVVDQVTGARLELPESFLARWKQTKLGSNWSSPDGNTNVDTLQFPGQLTLKAVFDKLHRVRGRTFSRNEWRGVKFTLEGRDRDGSTFLIEVHQGAVGLDDLKGYSIVHFQPRRDNDAIRARAAQTYQPFPKAGTPPPSSDAVTMVEPGKARQEAAASPYVVGGIALGDRVKEVAAYACRLNAAMEGVRWCRKNGGADENLPDAVMLGEDGSSIYVLANQSRGLSNKEAAEKEIIERSRVLKEQPAKIVWLPENQPTSVIALWGKIDLEELIYPDRDVVAGEANAPMGNVEDSKGNLETAQLDGSLFRIIGVKGFIYSATFGGGANGHRRLLAVDAAELATRQFKAKLAPLLRKDQSLPAGDFSLWPGVAAATRRLARDTSPAEANSALDTVFADAPSQKLRSHAWAVLPSGVQEGLAAGEYRTVDIYPPKTKYPRIRKDIERFLASDPKDNFREFPMYVIGEFEAALKASPGSVIAPVLHYGAGHRIVGSLAFDGVDALKDRLPDVEDDPDFIARDQRSDPSNEPINSSLRLLNRYEDTFGGDLTKLVPDFASRAQPARPHFEAVLQSKSTPLADDAAYMLSWIDFYSGQYEDAVAQFERAMSRGNSDYKEPAATKQMIRLMQEQYTPDRQSTLVGTNQVFAQQPALWYVAARSAYRLFRYEFVIGVTKSALDSLHVSVDRLPDTTDANIIAEDLERMNPDPTDINTLEIVYLYRASRELLDYTQLIGKIDSLQPAQFSQRARQIIMKYSLLIDAPENSAPSTSPSTHKDLRQALHLIDITLKSLPRNAAYDPLRDWLHYRKTRIAIIFAPALVESIVAAMEADVPQSKLMDDALAELIYFEGIKRDVKAAEAAFKKIQDKYPDGNAVDNAYTWMAKIYRCADRIEEAQKLNREILRKFPLTRHAILAGGRLANKEPKACAMPEEIEFAAGR